MINQTNEQKVIDIKRAIVTFVLSYVVIAILAVVVYMIIAMIMGVSLSAKFDIATDPAYALEEQLNPLLNLGVWGTFAWMYFRKGLRPTMKQAWVLGCFWLAIAVPLDFVYFVLIPNPLQVNAQGFYIEQFPWIYFTYAVVLASPALYLALKRRLV